MPLVVGTRSGRHQSSDRSAYRWDAGGHGTLELRVNSALSKDEQIKKEALHQRDGLSGAKCCWQAGANPELASRAKQIAMGVEGTAEVYNGIRRASRLVSAPRHLIRITAKCVPQLLYRPKILKRESDHGDGEVFLLGLVGTEREGESGSGYRQPGERREARHHRVYLCLVHAWPVSPVSASLGLFSTSAILPQSTPPQRHQPAVKPTALFAEIDLRSMIEATANRRRQRG